MSLKIVAISGSPSPGSSSSRLADAMLSRLPPEYQARHLRLSSLDPAALVRADTRDPGIAAAVEAVAQAHGLIIVTPIYKAACSGLLKCFLDLLDQFALTGKAVLPLATGGSLAHALALDYGLRPILQSMGARHVVQAVLVLSDQIAQDRSAAVGTPATDGMLREALAHFLDAVSSDPALSRRGHPGPRAGA